MSDWIADGEAGSSVRGKLNALPLRPISSVTISVPAGHVDFALPSGYSQFVFCGSDIRVTGSDLLAALCSIDGGSNFYSDNINNDTYGQILHVYTVGSGGFTSTPLGAVGNDSKMYVGDLGVDHGDSTAYSLDFDMKFYPGSTLKGFKSLVDATMFDFQGVSLATDVAALSKQLTFLNPNPTAGPPTLGRVNLVRFLPAFNVDGSTDNIISGKIDLFGYAA